MKMRKSKTSARKAGKTKLSSRKSVAGAKSLDAFMDASAKALGLAIDRSWRKSILANLDVTFVHAKRVMDFPLPDDADPAPIYRV